MDFAEFSQALIFPNIYEIILEKYAFISGGKMPDGQIIISMPETLPVERVITTETHKKIINYLVYTSLDEGSVSTFVIILDRRKNKATVVRHLIELLFKEFPTIATLDKIYLLQPNGLIESLRLFISGIMSEKEKIVLFSNFSEMHKSIPVDQLTIDFEGTLDFNLNYWLNTRMMIEDIYKETLKVKQDMKYLRGETFDQVSPDLINLQELRLVRSDMVDQSMCILTRLKVIQEKIAATMQKVNDLNTKDEQRHKNVLIRHEEHLKDIINHYTIRKDNTECMLNNFINIKEIELLNKELELELIEHKENFNDILRRDCLKDLHDIIPMLQNLNDITMENLSKLDHLKSQLSQFSINDYIENIFENLSEIMINYKDLKAKAEIEQNRLNIYFLLLIEFEKASAWISGINFEVDKITSILETLDSSEYSISLIKELEIDAKELLHEDISIWIKKTTDIIYREMVDKSIIKIDQQDLVNAEKKITDLLFLLENRRKEFEVKLSNSKSTRDKKQNNTISQNSLPIQLNDESQKIISYDKPAVIKLGSLMSLPEIEKYIPPRHLNEWSDMKLVFETGTIRRKRSHVVQELIETEINYTNELNTLIQGYYNQFENEELKNLIPNALQGQRDVLFGNIINIYDFHSNIFLKCLQPCSMQLNCVGRCFIENIEYLQMYSFYCQNKIKAEKLIDTVGINNPFFMECQKRIGHILPLSSYILKPVQRITKYHLLLKELVRMTTNLSEANELKEAIIAVCDVLRYVNNSMHQLSIIGFPGEILEHGRLLMQGALEICFDRRRDKVMGLKQTPKKRHAFLYDQSLVFCKRRDDGAYAFKNILPTSEIGPLVENPRGVVDNRKFELHRCQDMWLIVAPTPESKIEWISEIKLVLYKQMNSIRASSKRLHINNPITMDADLNISETNT